MGWNLLAIILAIIIVLAICGCLSVLRDLLIEYRAKWFFRFLRLRKTELAARYGVSPETLNNWIKEFAPSIDFESWKKKRVITGNTLFEVVAALGWPSKKQTLTKSTLAEQLGITKPTLKHYCTAKYWSEIALSENQYLAVNIFPPSIGNHIISILSQALLPVKR